MNNPQELIQKICEHYGCLDAEGNADPAALKKTQAWAKAFSRTKSVQDTLKELVRVTQPGVTVPGWFLGNRIFTRYNRDKRQSEVTGEGVKLLLEDGTITSIANNHTMDAPKLTRVIVGPVTVRRNLETGDERIVTPHKDTPVQAKEHEAQLPDLNAEEWLGNPNDVDEDGNPRSIGKLNELDEKRGVIRGESPMEYAIPFTLKIGDWDDVRYFPPGEWDESLMVTAYDSVGNKIDIRLPIEQVQEHFGLIGEQDPNAYKDALEGKAIFAAGRLKTTKYLNLDDATKEKFIEQARKEGFLVKNGEKRDPTSGRRVDVYALKFPEGTPKDQRAIELEDGTVVYDAREEKPNQWAFYTHVKKANRNPELDVVERSGVTNGYEWTMNEGAFLAFTEAAGFETPTDEKYAEAAKLLE